MYNQQQAANGITAVVHFFQNNHSLGWACLIFGMLILAVIPNLQHKSK
jgi:hypothetical protein